MPRNLLCSILLMLLAGTSLALAQENTGQDVDAEISLILARDQIGLADLFRLADLASPRLAVARSEIDAQAGRARQAGLYPNPTLELEVGELSLSDSGDRKDKISLVQPLILGGRRGAAVAAAQAQQQSALQGLNSTRRDVFLRVHTLWAEQLHGRAMKGALEELLVMANRTLEIAQTRFEARAAPESQVTRALLEVYELELVQQELIQRQAQAAWELASLMGGVQVPVDQLAGSLETSSLSAGEPLDSAALGDHPALQAAQKKIDAAEASLRQARATRIPDLGLFVTYGKSRAMDEDFIEAGLSVPLPFFDRNQGRVDEAQSLVAKARGQARIVDNDLKAALAGARQRYLIVHGQLEAATDRILPAAQRGLDQTQEGYRVGHLPFLELIDAQRTLASIRLRTMDLRKDLVVAEAELNSLLNIAPYGIERDRP